MITGQKTAPHHDIMHNVSMQLCERTWRPSSTEARLLGTGCTPPLSPRELSLLLLMGCHSDFLRPPFAAMLACCGFTQHAR